jgi:hypothetical protein
LIDWINSELADKRIIVKDISEDLYDGQILQMLIGKSICLLDTYKHQIVKRILCLEKLSGQKLSQESKINLGELSQKQNLKHILDFINQIMDIHPMMSKWKVEGY